MLITKVRILMNQKDLNKSMSKAEVIGALASDSNGTVNDIAKGELSFLVETLDFVKVNCTMRDLLTYQSEARDNLLSLAVKNEKYDAALLLMTKVKYAPELFLGKGQNGKTHIANMMKDLMIKGASLTTESKNYDLMVDSYESMESFLNEIETGKHYAHANASKVAQFVTSFNIVLRRFVDMLFGLKESKSQEVQYKSKIGAQQLKQIHEEMQISPSDHYKFIAILERSNLPAATAAQPKAVGEVSKGENMQPPAPDVTVNADLVGPRVETKPVVEELKQPEERKETLRDPIIIDEKKEKAPEAPRTDSITHEAKPQVEEAQPAEEKVEKVVEGAKDESVDPGLTKTVAGNAWLNRTENAQLREESKWLEEPTIKEYKWKFKKPAPWVKELGTKDKKKTEHTASHRPLSNISVVSTTKSSTEGAVGSGPDAASAGVTSETKETVIVRSRGEATIDKEGAVHLPAPVDKAVVVGGPDISIANRARSRRLLHDSLSSAGMKSDTSKSSPAAVVKSSLPSDSATGATGGGTPLDTKEKPDIKTKPVVASRKGGSSTVDAGVYKSSVMDSPTAPPAKKSDAPASVASLEGSDGGTKPSAAASAPVVASSSSAGDVSKPGAADKKGVVTPAPDATAHAIASGDTAGTAVKSSDTKPAEIIAGTTATAAASVDPAKGPDSTKL